MTQGTSAERDSRGDAPPSAPGHSCDQCRKRKVRCDGPAATDRGMSPVTSHNGQRTLSPPASCSVCKRRGQPCTYSYKYKKAGRPSGSSRSSKRTSSRAEEQSPIQPDPQDRIEPGLRQGGRSRGRTRLPTGQDQTQQSHFPASIEMQQSRTTRVDSNEIGRSINEGISAVEPAMLYRSISPTVDRPRLSAHLPSNIYRNNTAGSETRAEELITNVEANGLSSSVHLDEGHAARFDPILGFDPNSMPSAFDPQAQNDSFASYTSDQMLGNLSVSVGQEERHNELAMFGLGPRDDLQDLLDALSASNAIPNAPDLTESSHRPRFSDSNLYGNDVPTGSNESRITGNVNSQCLSAEGRHYVEDSLDEGRAQNSEPRHEDNSNLQSANRTNGGGNSSHQIYHANQRSVPRESYRPTASLPSPFSLSLAAPGADHIESLVPWGDVSSFVSLFVRYQEALVPVIHRPSFALDIMYRRDQRDEAFRGLLFSIVSYTICQCPIKMLSGSRDRTSLEILLRGCQRASRIIQIRHQMKPNFLTLASTILDWITSQATTSRELSDNLINDVRRLIYGLELHQNLPREGMIDRDVQLGRRLFWEAFAIDKTNALSGQPMILNDTHGMPPLPSELGDESLDYTSPSDTGQMNTGSYAHASTRRERPSLLVGFVAISKIFVLLSKCLRRQTTLLSSDSASGGDRVALLEWIPQARQELEQIIHALPTQLQPDYCPTKGADLPYGIQAANICITSLCVEQALYDLNSSLCPEHDTASERQQVAERALSHLQRIPIHCLAMNGESMRGKVLRIVLSLLTIVGPSSTLGTSVAGWSDMYSNIEFLQIIPNQAAPVVPTRPQTPSWDD